MVTTIEMFVKTIEPFTLEGLFMAMPQCLGVTKQASVEPAMEPTMWKRVVSKASMVATAIATGEERPADDE